MAEQAELTPRYIQANGLEFAYLEAGANAHGPLVICLHGFPDLAWSYSSLLPRLAEAGFRAIAPFMRGYPPTALPDDRDYSGLALGRDVLALIEHFGASKACLIGHDWGAVATYIAASMRPDRVQKIVTAAVPHPRRFILRPSRAQWRASAYMRRFQFPGAEKMIREDDFVWLQELIKTWSPGWEPPAEFVDKLKTAFSEPDRLKAALAYYRALPRTLLRRDAWGHMFRPIQVPARVIHGGKDGCILPQSFKGQEHLFGAGYKLVSMPESGHFMHLEQPDVFVDHVLAFLKEA